MDNIPPSLHWCRTKTLRVPPITRFMGLFRTAPAAPPATSTASRYTPSSLAASTLPPRPPGNQYSAVFSNSSGQQTAYTVSQTQRATQGASRPIQSYILFGVQGGKRALVPAQVRVYDRSTDASIFRELRQCYRAQRGRLRLWFSVWRLENCAVVKVNVLSKPNCQPLTSPVKV